MEINKKTIENDEAFLRQISKEVDFRDNSYLDVIDKLAYYCKNDDNILAIASVQLGIPLRLIYLKKTNLDEFENKEYNEMKVMINPVIISKEGLTRYWEACASCLDNTGLVERPYKIEVEYYDEEKTKHREVFEGFPATVLCHEIDHLDGILHIDVALEIKKMNKDERREFRKTHPYEIVRKDGIYKRNKAKI